MNHSSPAHHAANSTLVGWVDGGTDRGTLDILYASCVTIILCIWVSTYPNVPAPSDRWYHRIIDKANLAAIGALSPDLLFALALGQYSSAKRSIKAFKSEWPDLPWTITHAFYADMGGFRITSNRDPYSIPVNSRQLLYLIKHKHVEFPRIKEKALTEMSSGDAFSKVIVIWQVVWFVITTITRLANGLPITTLEVTAFIYAVMMVATSMAWFQKPQINVSTFLPLAQDMSFEDVRRCAQQTTHPTMTDWHETPFDFIWKRGSLKIDKDWQFASRLSHKLCVPFFTRLPGRPWARMPSDIWIQPKVAVAVPATVLQIPYSLSFLWAWNFHFASKAEQILWRSSAVFHAVYIWFITLHYMYYLKKPNAAQTSGSLPRPNFSRPLPTCEFEVEESLQEIPASPSEEKRSRLHRIKRYIAQWRNTTPTQDPDHEMSLRWSCCILALTFLYTLAHVFIGIEDFISLRSQPADIYRTPGEYFPLIN